MTTRASRAQATLGSPSFIIAFAALAGAACSSGSGRAAGGAGGSVDTRTGGHVDGSGGQGGPNGGSVATTGGAAGPGGVSGTGGTTASRTGGTTASATGGTTASGTGGTTARSDAVDAALASGGAIAGGARAGGATTGAAGAPGGTTVVGTAGTTAAGGAAGGSGGATGLGRAGSGGTASAGGVASADASSCTGPVGTFSGELASGIAFVDDRGDPVNAHGGGIIKVGDTYYMHGEYFLSTTTDNAFNGFAMYSSRDLATWTWERMILPQQPSGLLGPNRKGERPHIIKCPQTGEFVLFAHAASADYQTDKEVVYATSATVNGVYAFQGALTNASGTTAAHSDMSAFADGNGAYVLTESGHVYTLTDDCHGWVSDKAFSAVNGDSGGSESPTVFKAGSTYYWIGSYKTGWRANNNFYSTAPAMTGPWTYQGFIAPVTDTSTATPSDQPNPPEWISDQRTWLSQSTWVTPVAGCNGTVYVYWGDHWYGTQDTSNPGKHNDKATYVFQPLIFDGTKISMPVYFSTWKLDVGAGTWSH